MSQLNHLIQSRASYRKYIKEEIALEDIKKMLFNAGMAPSGHNNQPWKFIVIKNHEIIKRIAECVTFELEKNYNEMPDRIVTDLKGYKFFLEHFKDAPVIIAVLGRKDDYTTSKLKKKQLLKLEEPIHFDMELLGIGAAIENLILTAEDLNYGSCWLTEPVMYAQSKIENILGVKDPYHFVSLISLTKRDKIRKSMPKKTIEEIMQIID